MIRKLAATTINDPAQTPDDAAALAFLGDVLLGDANWSLAELRDMLAMHALNGLAPRHPGSSPEAQAPAA